MGLLSTWIRVVELNLSWVNRNDIGAYSSRVADTPVGVQQKFTKRALFGDYRGERLSNNLAIAPHPVGRCSTK